MEDHFVSEGMQMKTMKKKRKEVEELDQVNDDFSDFSLSSPARKIRRLVCKKFQSFPLLYCSQASLPNSVNCSNSVFSVSQLMI